MTEGSSSKVSAAFVAFGRLRPPAKGQAVDAAASCVCLSVASHSFTMSADAISRLITNITLVVRRRMRHTRRGNQRGGARNQQGEKKTAAVCACVYVCAQLPVAF